MTEVRTAYNVGLRMARPEAVTAVVLYRPWRCATGEHILGQVHRSKGVRRLLLGQGHVITGPAKVWCAECREYREWHAGEDGIREILEGRERMRRAVG